MSEAAKTTATAQSEEIVRSQQPGELQNIQAAYRLNRKNYLKWSQLVRTVLKGKGKISHREWGQKGEQPRNNCHAHVAAVQQNEAAPQELGNLNQEEVEMVRSLIGNLDKPSGTCSLAYSGRGFGEDDWTC
ncbi:uncharacterized protein LOC132172685 [Corylus avellana]|uniref:uncharacterized protein LOC132172685 n=1 Tax=Corylus avellana TaxID=13451 RepID=UPI00286C385A|nr:uncharacterized protein LOC132172685 [Corylus avellana]